MCEFQGLAREAGRTDTLGGVGILFFGSTMFPSAADGADPESPSTEDACAIALPTRIRSKHGTRRISLDGLLGQPLEIEDSTCA